jgi:hypothetical protein
MTDIDKPAVPPQVPPGAVPPPGTPAPPLAVGESHKILAVCSIGVAIIGILIFGLILDPIAILLGVIARKKMKASGNYDGKGFALAGIIAGIIGTVIPAVLVIIALTTRH